MHFDYPEHEPDKRAALLAAVEAIRPVLTAEVQASEDGRTLSADAVTALREAGMFALKVPRELGGIEADFVTQMDVFEALAYIDGAIGWTAFIGCGATTMTAYVPAAGIERMWTGGRIPTAAVVVMPGRALRVAGGYRVDGRWSWASGIRHAEWVGVHVLVERADAAPDSRLAFLPIAEVELHDNWHVAGLKGTGSCDFSIHDRFVPADLTFDLRALVPLRGGPMYRVGLPGLVAHELGGFALGVATRALDEIREQARNKKRGYTSRTTIADRGVFRRMLGESDLRLRAVRALLAQVYTRAWHSASAGEAVDVTQQLDMRGAVAFAVHTAVDVAQQAFRYGGGTALHLDNPLQRCVRDLDGASVHLFSTDAIYEELGRKLLGAEDLNPMV
ncbi:MAG: acyl-CoA dehydrogenase family protein [Gammaproteobacteria bacterium]